MFHQYPPLSLFSLQLIYEITFALNATRNKHCFSGSPNSEGHECSLQIRKNKNRPTVEVKDNLIFDSESLELNRRQTNDPSTFLHNCQEAGSHHWPKTIWLVEKEPIFSVKRRGKNLCWLTFSKKVSICQHVGSSLSSQVCSFYLSSSNQ